jgi:hypothetical protein
METNRKPEKRYELTAEPISAKYLSLQWMSQPITDLVDPSSHLLHSEISKEGHMLTADKISAEYHSLQWISGPITAQGRPSPHISTA